MTYDLLFDFPVESKSEYKFINSSTELEFKLSSYLTADEIGLDIETTGLDPYKDQIRLLQLSSRDAPNLLIDAYAINNWIDLLKPLFKSSAIKIIHNAKFELKFFYHLGIDIKGVIFDTMLASQLLAAGHQLKHKLSDLVERYLSIEMDKSEQKSDWNQLELRPSQLAYASNDVEYLIPLYDKLRLELRHNKMRKVAKLEFDTVHAVAQMELAGFGLDRQRLDQYLNQLAVEHQKLEAEIINKLGPINVNSPKQLKEALFKVGIILGGTNREALNQYAELPVIFNILEYRKIEQLKSTYGEKLISSLHPITGRLHSDYFQLGTNTGRMSCREPNIQSIVNGELRSCFRPESGYKLIVVDYSQIELRVLAGMAQDFKMIEALNQGIDLHKLTASIVTQKAMDEVSKDEREIAKTLNFGLVYGAGIDNLAKHLQQKGLMVNRSEMEEFKKRFLKRFIGGALYIRRATKGRKYEIRTLSGRRKEFPPDKFGLRKSASYTEKLNTPIQGSAADIAKLGLYKVSQVLKGTKGKLVAFIHDEVIVEIPTEQAEELLPQIEQALKEAGQYYLPNVEISLSANICDSWMEKSA